MSHLFHDLLIHSCKIQWFLLSLEDEKSKSNDITSTDRTLDVLFDEIKLSQFQKFSLVLCYIVLIIAIIGLLEFTKHFKNPEVPNVVR